MLGARPRRRPGIAAACPAQADGEHGEQPGQPHVARLQAVARGDEQERRTLSDASQSGENGGARRGNRAFLNSNPGTPKGVLFRPAD
jgi:hypothetical protein